MSDITEEIKQRVKERNAARQALQAIDLVLYGADLHYEPDRALTIKHLLETIEQLQSRISELESREAAKKTLEAR